MGMKLTSLVITLLSAILVLFSLSIIFKIYQEVVKSKTVAKQTVPTTIKISLFGSIPSASKSADIIYIDFKDEASGKISTLPVKPDIQIDTFLFNDPIIRQKTGEPYQKLSPETLYQIYNTGKDPNNLTKSPWDITIENKTVTSISQRYTP
jgi:hypothetical protein